MRKCTNDKMRQGSALLIVLGMLSFMVVSAVGFSVYMRQSRLPSSYLSRNVSARHLARAALANAIEDLEGGFMSQYDIGINDTYSPDNGYFYGLYDDPYPGIGPQSNESPSKHDEFTWTRNGNYWFKRVFCPFGLLPYPKNDTEARLEPIETVPTLTLEALAYLPPAIIDDVRMVSRLTRTAKWRSLPYGSGRYAFTAVNVSDLLDINRLRANVPRNSGRDRITLATLTSDDPENPMTMNVGRAQQLDTILDKVENSKIGGRVVPFTSLADFNMAALNTSFAPLMRYIGMTSAGLQQSSETANAMFITDTWFPSTNATAGAATSFDLGGVDGAGQPFLSSQFTANSFIEVLTKLNSQNSVNQVYMKNLGLGLVCLYDYLDSDSVPISLALPTVEATPMVVGVSSPAGLKPDFGSIGSPVVAPEFSVPGTGTDSDGNVTPLPAIPIKRTLTQKGISSMGNSVIVQCLATYPFKRMISSKRMRSGDFKVRGIMKVWLAPQGMGCRPGVQDSLYPYPEDIAAASSGGLAKNGVATFVTDSFTAGTAFNKFTTDITMTDQAVDTFSLVFSSLNVEMPVYWEVKEEVGTVAGYTAVTPEEGKFKASYKTIGGIKGLDKALRPLKLDGGIHDEWKSTADSAPYVLNKPYGEGLTEMGALQENFRLYAAVWVQVLNKQGKVVDMAPACITDDIEWLGANVPDNGTTSDKCGSGAPLLNFMGDTEIAFGPDMEEKLQVTPSFSWKTLYAVDPRYNFAPEDWFSDSAQVVDKNTWLTHVKQYLGKTVGNNRRDRDIFMFVSDQEYLQSIGELQFLPVVSRMDGNDNFLTGRYSPSWNGKAFSVRTTPTSSELANANRFWCTYKAYFTGNDDTVLGDNQTENLNPYMMRYNGAVVSFESSGGTFKINPYTDDDRILAAAFAGTPYDYYVASTNEYQRQSGGQQNQLLVNGELDNLTKMISTYSFGDSPVAQMSKDTLLDIMDQFREDFKEKATSQKWDDIWADLEWQNDAEALVGDQNNLFMGCTIPNTCPLHGVDRKFLYSYWKDCFANQQQLFLLFVRAEPTSIGGGAAGKGASSQLGARAVALVWRDPTVPTGTTGGTRTNRRNITTREQFRELKKTCPPHRTRVLFYHQFD